MTATGQVYEYDYENKKCHIVVVNVNATHIEYKMIDAETGELSRRPYPMTREMWNTAPDNLRMVGTMVLPA